MYLRILLCSLVVASAPSAFSATKPHTVALGKSITVKLFADEDESHAVELKIRPLLVDGQAKEYLLGTVHDVTARIFVAQRVYRLNDTLPQESSLRWRWQRGGWLQVDRVTGKVQPLTLQSFEPDLSNVSWFRDYAAYCGFSDDGQKVFAMVTQISRRKPLLKSPVGSASEFSSAGLCGIPEWQRNPSRVAFSDANKQKVTFSIRSRMVDVSSPIDSDGEE